MSPRSAAAFGRQVSFWRARMPLVVLLIIILTFVSTVAGLFFERQGVPVVQYGVLWPKMVWEHHQFWRLLTWIFFEVAGDRTVVNLIFGCLIIYFTGRDLCQTWGWRRYLMTYLAFGVGIGAFTTFIGLAYPEVYEKMHMGCWPIAEAMIIAWATAHPDRQIALFLVLPVGGRALVVATIGLTVVFALVYGMPTFVPHFLAEGMMLVYMGGLRKVWLRFKLQRLERQKKRYVDNVIRLDRREAQRDRDRKDDDDGDVPPGKPGKWLN
jgi:membrane associated rhomboid family serine protease